MDNLDIVFRKDKTSSKEEITIWAMAGPLSIMFKDYSKRIIDITFIEGIGHIANLIYKIPKENMNRPILIKREIKKKHLLTN
jgi:hypothetical protein